MLLRRGVIEVETLRRYGRVPPGTRARGSLTLSRTGSSYLGYCLKIHIQVGSDPRPVGCEIHFEWDRAESVPLTWWTAFRGGCVKVEARDLFDGAIQQATLHIEDQSTRKGHQRFRVTRAEWQGGE